VIDTRKTLVLEGSVLRKLEDIAFKPLIDNEKHEGFIFFKRLRLVENLPVMYEQNIYRTKICQNLSKNHCLKIHFFAF